jgi:phage baseplate assembly protein W
MSPKSNGEVRWRPDFGSGIHGLLFRHTGPGLEDLIRHRVLEAIQRWEPRVRIKSISIQMYQTESGQTGNNAVDARMVYDIVTGRNGGVVTFDVFQREIL